MLCIGKARCKLRVSSKLTAITTHDASPFPRFPPMVALYRPVIGHAVPVAAPLTRLPFIIHHTSFATQTPRGFQQGNDIREKMSSKSKPSSSPESSDLPQDDSIDSSGTVRSDLKSARETLSLSNVPKEPFFLGLAGTLPYLGTSVSTVYLSWLLNTKWTSSSSFVNSLMIDKETASQFLAMLEPIQLGYGAVIISFLGAIHWGLEYAEKVPDRSRTRFRYGIGVVASIAAWPTLYLPVEFALTSQFAAFVALYFADAQATVRGWAPDWYSTYRFALTAVVGVAISLSLIGRAKVGDASPRWTGLSGKFHERHGEEGYTKKWQDLEQKERVKIRKEKERAVQEKKQARERDEKKVKDTDNSDADKSDADQDHAEGQQEKGGMPSAYSNKDGE